MIILEFTFCEVVFDMQERWLVTHFPDGTSVHSSPPTDTPHNRDLAHRLGYRSDPSCALWEMSVDHDIGHVLLAELRGERSRTLWRLAHGDDPALCSDDEVALEEAEVLAYQAMLRGRVAPC